MFIDARTLPNETRIQTDVCIVGGGAAGITLAREFIGGTVDVCLLESGGLEFNSKTQSLYKGENVGFPYYDLELLRLRYFGGTTNHWGGTCRPLDEIDFERRDWVSHSGWPFDKSHMDPYYRRAHAVCQLGPYDYNPGSLETDSNRRIPLKGDRVTTAMAQQSPPTRFGQVYREEIRAAKNIKTYLYANVVDIETNSSFQKVGRLRVATLEGHRFWVSAKVFILATGAIENARLLLNSDKGQKGGLGNSYDLVGRYFMEHLSVPGALLLPSDPNLQTGLYSAKQVKGVTGEGFLTLTAETLRKEELLNVRVWLLTASPQELMRNVSGWTVSAERILKEGRTGNLSSSFMKDLWNVISDIDEVAIYTYRKLVRPARGVLSLYYHIEHAPNPESRVSLASDRDQLGMKEVKLAWRFGDLERRTLRRTNQIVGEEMGAAGIGRIQEVHGETETGWPPGLRGAWHQMGTTRMDSDATKGVVDENCRIHGLSNLYVAGSSVFPTSGYTNPTLTIVALSLRLADHVKGVMN
jgi:choline dehydrogenase-like flavoprotein